MSGETARRRPCRGSPDRIAPYTEPVDARASSDASDLHALGAVPPGVGGRVEDGGIDPKAVLPWNAYPWYIEHQMRPTASMIVEGLLPLRNLLRVSSAVRFVIPGGGVASDSWKRFGSRYPEESLLYEHVETFHTSRRGITNGGRQKRDEGIAHVVSALRMIHDY